MPQGGPVEVVETYRSLRQRRLAHDLDIVERQGRAEVQVRRAQFAGILAHGALGLAPGRRLAALGWKRLHLGVVPVRVHALSAFIATGSDARASIARQHSAASRRWDETFA